MDSISQIFEAQKRFSALNIDVRLDALRGLFSEIRQSQDMMCAALRLDLWKC